MLNDSRKNLITLLNTVEDKSISMKKSVKHPAFDELPLINGLKRSIYRNSEHITNKRDKVLLDVRD